MKKNLIFGVTGQTGSYLADILYNKGDEVIGVVRRSSNTNHDRIKHLVNRPNFRLVEGDITDYSSVHNIISSFHPHKIYNMAAQSVHPESIIPTWTTGGIKFLTIEQLWKNFSQKNNIREEYDSNGLLIEVIDLPNNTNIKVLGYWNGMGTWKPLKQLSRHKYNGNLVQMTQKFGRVILTPNHSALDSQNQIFSPLENKTLLCMRKLNWIRSHNINTINFCNNEYSELDLEFIVDFLAFFIAEGWTSKNKTTNNYTVGICGQNKQRLLNFQEKLSTITNSKWYLSENKKDGYLSVWQLTTNNKDLFFWLRKNCGINSEFKKMPTFIFMLSTEIQNKFLNTLIEGDGCYTNYKQYQSIRYTTKSQLLVSQLCFLLTQLKKDYTIHFEDKQDSTYYHLRECTGYQPQQGENKIKLIPFNGYVYDISVPDVTNFTIGLGNIVVHNSHVGSSFAQPLLTWDVTAKGVVNILEVLREFKDIKFLQASSSEMFGDQHNEDEQTHVHYQDENTIMNPQSPYAIAKLAAYHAVRLYRNSYGLFACNAICFNMESPRRGENFVTRKITRWIGNFLAWKNSLEEEFLFDYNLPPTHISTVRTNSEVDLFGPKFEKLHLGNVYSFRDWGHARNYAEAMILMMASEKPDDFVIGSERTHSVRDFLTIAFEYAGLGDWKNYVHIDDTLKRPSEVPYLRSKTDKIRGKLSWAPSTSFEDLVKEMVDYDIELAKS